MLNEKRHIHFIGIGGIGMSALAEIMHRKGWSVSGSDPSENEQTGRLKSLGVTVYSRHDASQVQGDIVVFSSAIGMDNPELAEAGKRGILCVKRAELLGEFLREKKGIAVSGTHGKTTTSAMIGMMMVHADLDPTLFVGGIITEIGSNSRLGGSEWIVAEADEYDRSFLQLHPQIAVINNIEADHLDCYKDLNDLKDTFIRFANQTSLFGMVLVNADEPGSRSVIPFIRRRVVTYGVSEHTDIHAEQIRILNGKTEFHVSIFRKPAGILRLGVPGHHQITNALACAGAGWATGIPFSVIQSSLEQFRGTQRRFEIIGELSGVTWIDDYAHHPTEIRATLNAAKERYPGRRIVAVFQPHLYSRTRDFLNDFAEAFGDAASVWLTGIYAAREKPCDSADWAQKLFESVRTNHPDVHFVPDRDSVLKELLPGILRDDVIITMGAGDITNLGRNYLKKESHD